jgi:GT2 family glycosyltransferase
MNFKYDLSICILTKNNNKILTDCINSIISTTLRYNYEIILVDSSDNYDTYNLVNSKYNWIKYIQNKFFLGFSSGNNQAFNISEGRYICILNDDTILNSNCFDLLLDNLVYDENIGAIGPKLLNSDGSLQISSFLTFPNLYSELVTTCIQFSYFKEKFNFCFKFNNSITNYGIYNNLNKKLEVKHLMGACIIFPSHIISEIGGLDENFFLSMEDQDLCRRISALNKKIIYQPQAELIHLGGQSVSKIKESFNKIYLDSKLYFFKKYNPLSYPFIYFCIFIITINNISILMIYKYLNRNKVNIASQLTYELNKFNYLKQILLN